MKKKIKISAVSYTNTLPFIYGIENSKLLSGKIELKKDIPSICADKLISGEADLGLIPVAEISRLKNPKIISKYCIGATGKVDSVLLLSNVPAEKIKKIILDYQSRTSVKLTKILAKEYFKINPEYTLLNPEKENETNNNEAVLIIGDRAFKHKKKYKYVYDLAEIWMKHTSLPFVFAAWVSNKELDEKFISEFNNALKSGLENIKEIIEKYQNKNKYDFDVKKYLTERISYNLDSEKRKAMNLFLTKIKNSKI